MTAKTAAEANLSTALYAQDLAGITSAINIGVSKDALVDALSHAIRHNQLQTLEALSQTPYLDPDTLSGALLYLSHESNDNMNEAQVAIVQKILASNFITRRELVIVLLISLLLPEEQSRHFEPIRGMILQDNRVQGYFTKNPPSQSELLDKGLLEHITLESIEELLSIATIMKPQEAVVRKLLKDPRLTLHSILRVLFQAASGPQDEPHETVLRVLLQSNRISNEDFKEERPTPTRKAITETLLTKASQFITDEVFDDTLTTAAQNGRIQIVRMLLEQKRLSREHIHNAFSAAAEKNQMKIVEILYAHSLMTPEIIKAGLLEAAAWGDHEAIVEMLLLNDSLTSEQVHNTLSLAAYENCDANIARRLLEDRRMSDQGVQSARAMATQQGHQTLADLMQPHFDQVKSDRALIDQIEGLTNPLTEAEMITLSGNIHLSDFFARETLRRLSALSIHQRLMKLTVLTGVLKKLGDCEGKANAEASLKDFGLTIGERVPSLLAYAAYTQSRRNHEFVDAPETDPLTRRVIPQEVDDITQRYVGAKSTFSPY